MTYFKFDNRKIFYNTIGSGEPILLLQGNTASSKMFDSILETYSKDFKLILLDYPGHGKSERVEKFETDFWFYNSTVCFALLNELKIDKVSVIGTSGGALIGINFALEYPEKVNFLVADSFMGEYPLTEIVDHLKPDREKSKKNKFAQEFWDYNHGFDWKNIVDSDTEMFLEFSKPGKSFLHKPIAELSVPTILTGSKEDEIITALYDLYADLKNENDKLEIFLFETGNHPAMLSNADKFYHLVKEKIKLTDTVLK